MTARRKPVKPLVAALMQPGIGYTSVGIARAVGATRAVVGQCLRRMVADQCVWQVPAGRDHLYFNTEQGAADCTAAEAAALVQRQAAPRSPASKQARAAAAARRYAVVPPKPGRPAGVLLTPAPTEPQPVDMSGAVWTRAKRPLDRFEVDPASVAPGAFVTDLPAGRWSDYAVRGAA